MDKNYLVTKSNYFIMNSNYDLSLEEQKLILTLASMVQPTDEEFKPYKFRIANFMELLGVEDKSKYTQIPKITKELMKKVLEIQEGNTLLQVAWLNSARYEKGSGMVTLKFSPDLKPYMLQLKEKFTQYQLGNVLTMKSKYSPRIYEILKCNEFKKQGYTEVEIDELRRLLKAEQIYPLYADFKRFIIMQAQKELKKSSDISFDFKEIKTGRKVTSLRFYINNNRKKVNEISEIAITIDEFQDIKYVQAIIKEEISENEAKKILEVANGNINMIEDKYAIVQNMSDCKNVVGALMQAIKENWTSKASSKRPGGNFNNYTQRKYDVKELEKRLLGIDEEE